MAARQPDPTGLLTLERFQAMAEPEDHRLELDEGRLVREPLPATAHGIVVIRLGAALHAWAEANGGMVAGESGFVLRRDPPTVRGPDLSWLAPGRLGYPVPHGFLDGAPELAVEILSPSNTAAEMRRKVGQYLEAGARLVWVIDPRKRTVAVHAPNTPPRTLREADELTGEDLLPGFRIEIARLFG